MIETSFQKRVRYSEIDRMGYLYYGRYAELYEIGRAEMIRELGVSYRALEDDYKVMMPVVSLQCRYKAPALYDDQLTIITQLKAMPRRMIEFEHLVKNAKGDLLNTGSTKLFFVHTETGKNVSCPKILSDVILPHF